MKHSGDHTRVQTPTVHREHFGLCAPKRTHLNACENTFTHPVDGGMHIWRHLPPEALK